MSSALLSLFRHSTLIWFSCWYSVYNVWLLLTGSWSTATGAVPGVFSAVSAPLPIDDLWSSWTLFVEWAWVEPDATPVLLATAPGGLHYKGGSACNHPLGLENALLQDNSWIGLMWWGIWFLRPLVITPSTQWNLSTMKTHYNQP